MRTNYNQLHLLYFEFTRAVYIYVAYWADSAAAVRLESFRVTADWQLQDLTETALNLLSVSAAGDAECRTLGHWAGRQPGLRRPASHWLNQHLKNSTADLSCTLQPPIKSWEKEIQEEKKLQAKFSVQKVFIPDIQFTTRKRLREDWDVVIKSRRITQLIYDAQNGKFD